MAQRARLLDRIRAAGRLRDRFVAEVYDVGETEAGLPFVVMELVPGRSLGSLLAEGELSYPTAVTVGAQVAAALAAAHARRGAH
ncbi:hypothetical protein AB0M54_26520 [Actinoplanes sp. NPDC051470]|uniref:hypothetical protein n=1 Tax=Actinoplanes sp. NPDC051470 TaxID=3157224 RepID=UPI00343F4FB3